MSRFVEVLLSDFRSVPGLTEHKAIFGGEEASYDPPRYSFGDLKLELVPLAEHVKKVLPAALREADHCLELPESLVTEWSGRRLEGGERAALQGFLECVARQPRWAVVSEHDSGEGVQLMVCAPEELFDRMDEHMSERGNAALVIFSCLA